MRDRARKRLRKKLTANLDMIVLKACAKNRSGATCRVEQFFPKTFAGISNV